MNGTKNNKLSFQQFYTMFFFFLSTYTFYYGSDLRSFSSCMTVTGDGIMECCWLLFSGNLHLTRV